jgi:hypothetical protein
MGAAADLLPHASAIRPARAGKTRIIRQKCGTTQYLMIFNGKKPLQPIVVA